MRNIQQRRNWWRTFTQLFYERVPEACMTRRWHGCAYRDWSRFETVMVIWPLHYAVQFAHWLGYKWDKHRHRKSWIDRQIDAAVKHSEEQDARRYVRRAIFRQP